MTGRRRRSSLRPSVYVSIGLTDDWRVDATEAEPAAAAAALPEVDGLYARMAIAGGADAQPADG